MKPLKKIFISIGALFGLYLLVGLLFQICDPLKIVAYRWDSSLVSIKNNENKIIKLVEMDINDKYFLKNFPDGKDTSDYALIYNFQRGKQYILPNEEIYVATKYFHDKNGVIFNSQTTIVTSISITAEVGSGLFNTRVHAGHWE